MRSSRERAGLGVATLGAAVLLASLWQPWYRFQLPPAFLDQVARLSGQFGSFGAYLREGATRLATHGPYHLSGWLVFKGFDVVLCGLAILGLLLGLQALVASGRLVLVPEGRAFALLGLIGSVLVVYHIVRYPLPREIVALDRGAWLALAGSGAMLAGGLVGAAGAGARAGAGSEEPSEIRWDDGATPATAPSAAWSTASSVAPPPGA